MNDEILKKIDLEIDEADVFELFKLHKRLAILEGAKILGNESRDDIEALIDRVQEKIIFKRESL